ncbi:MAG: threonine ammonia-lyase, biosynthetic [Chloroflexi bacterium]|nr:threonine ammonia-lyase, biosynthetic [Chloroflexota bacterium]
MQTMVASVYAARTVVRRYLAPTPLFHSPRLSSKLGCEVHVKCENLSPIRSFKARGAIYCLSRLAKDRGGVVCASTGNHGQGMAFAARQFGRRAVVIVPESTTEQKIAAMRYFGADLRIAGRNLAEAIALAHRVGADEDLVYVEDGEDLDVLVGCATLGLEVIEQLPDLDYMFVPVGGGNLIAATSLIVKALRPDATVVGVQSAEAPAVYESWRARRLLNLERSDTFAGGLATSYPCGLAFDIIQSSVDDMVLVPDQDLIDAALTMLAEVGQLPEGAGAAGLAALLANPDRCRGRKVVVVLSGGNFEPVIWSRLQDRA